MHFKNKLKANAFSNALSVDEKKQGLRDNWDVGLQQFDIFSNFRRFSLLVYVLLKIAFLYKKPH